MLIYSAIFIDQYIEILGIDTPFSVKVSREWGRALCCVLEF